MIKGDEAPRALKQQAWLLAAPKVAWRVDEMRSGVVIARRQRPCVPVGVFPGQQFTDRSAVAAGRQPCRVLRNQPVQDEVHACGLADLA